MAAKWLCTLSYEMIRYIDDLFDSCHLLLMCRYTLSVLQASIIGCNNEHVLVRALINANRLACCLVRNRNFLLLYEVVCSAGCG